MKVSIITVSYNSEDTLEDTIKSVGSQDYPDIEYLIIDGESTDGTLSLVEKYKDKIAKVVSEPDQGMYDALNKGIELASGDLIGILNSDDYYTDQKVISDVVDKVKATKADACYGDLVYVDRHNLNKVKRFWKARKYRSNYFKWGWMPPHPTFFVKKSCYQQYGKFNLNLFSAADYELMLRFIHKHEVKLAYLPRVIVKMREGGMSNTNILSRLRGNREDQKAWRINGLKPNALTFFLKPFRKVLQFLPIRKGF
ncbi:MAG: glycosyltransferase family 2 protein [Vicingaceae bacterium]